MYISIGPSPTIDIIYGLPSDVYQLGCLRRLIFLVWTTLRSFLVLDNPPKPFSLDSSHALTPTVLGCPSAYGMHDANSIIVYNTCKYINMHIFTLKLNHTIMLCNFSFHHIQISSRGLMIKHEQFYLNYSTKHINSQNLFCGHYSRD